MDVVPAQGFEHLGWAQVWLHDADEAHREAAESAARAIGASALEVWTTDGTPLVAPALERHGYELVRQYAISELDLAAAGPPAAPALPLTTLAARPELAPQLYEVALAAYRDQPGRADSRLSPYEVWRTWSIDPHPSDACFVALEEGRVLGYGYLTVDGTTGTHAFTGLLPEARGRGIAGAIRRAQIGWAKEHGLAALRTANELRLRQMLSLNERLGYRRLYTELVLRRSL